MLDADDLKRAYERKLKSNLTDDGRNIDLSQCVEKLCNAFGDFIDSIPPSSADGLIQALKNHFADEDGIAAGEYWKHEEVIKVIKAYCKGE